MNNKLLNEELGRIKSLFDYNTQLTLTENIVEQNIPGINDPNVIGTGRAQEPFYGVMTQKGYERKWLQELTNDLFCNTKNGVIASSKNPSWNGDRMSEVIKLYNISPEELAIAKASCPTSELAKNPTDALNPQANKPKIVFTPNEKFPLKFQQKGENIRLMQQKLGMPANLQTGNFYGKTEQYVKKVAPEYKRETGVIEPIWNKIFNIRSKTNMGPEKTIKPEAPTSAAPQTLPNTQPQQIQTNQPAPTERQIRQANRRVRR